MTDLTVNIEKTIHAPIERVYDAWLDPSLVAQWFAPPPMRAEVQTLEAEAGGSYRIDMVPPEGPIMTVTGTYETLERPRRLVFGWDWGEISEAPSQVEVNFSATDGGTRLVLEHRRLAPPAVEAHADGWVGILSAFTAAMTAASES